MNAMWRSWAKHVRGAFDKLAQYTAIRCRRFCGMDAVSCAMSMSQIYSSRSTKAWRFCVCAWIAWKFWPKSWNAWSHVKSNSEANLRPVKHNKNRISEIYFLNIFLLAYLGLTSCIGENHLCKALWAIVCADISIEAHQMKDDYQALHLYCPVYFCTTKRWQSADERSWKQHMKKFHQ